MKELYIQREVVLRERRLCIDGREVFCGQSGSTAQAFLGEVYKFLGLNYLRFYKMDALSKTLFLASEALLQGSGLPSESDNPRVALVLQNSHSSIDTDKLFQNTIHSESYLPGPSLFVYTLPNVALGEVAIRNKFTGENATFIASSFHAESCLDYVQALFARTEMQYCLCGWFDYMDEREEARVFLVTEKKTEKLFNINTLK